MVDNHPRSLGLSCRRCFDDESLRPLAGLRPGQAVEPWSLADPPAGRRDLEAVGEARGMAGAGRPRPPLRAPPGRNGRPCRSSRQFYSQHQKRREIHH